MTKAELIKALENIEDNEELVFTYTDSDRDGWAEERVATVEKVESKTAHTARVNAKEIANLTAWIAEAEATIEKTEAAILADNKPTKAAAKRNADRVTYIERATKRIAWYHERIEKLVKA